MALQQQFGWWWEQRCLALLLSNVGPLLLATFSMGQYLLKSFVQQETIVRKII
jgi:hypothetical protein